MRDVRERPAVDERRLALERLHEVRLDRVLQHDCHRARRLDVLGRDRLALGRLADGDAAEPLPQVGEVARDGDEAHDLARRSDVEAGLARRSVRTSAETGDHVAQVPVVHVHAPAPGDRERIEPGGVPVVEVRVDERGEEVVRGRDRVQVAGEVEVQVFHGHDLRVAASGRASLDPEHRTQRGLAQAQDRLAPEHAETLGQRDRRRRLALARGRRRDRRDVDQLGIGAVGQPIDDREVDLRLVAAVRLDLVVLEPELVRDVEDRPQGRGLRDLEAGGHHGRHRPGRLVTDRCRGQLGHERVGMEALQRERRDQVGRLARSRRARRASRRRWARP